MSERPTATNSGLGGSAVKVNIPNRPIHENWHPILLPIFLVSTAATNDHQAMTTESARVSRGPRLQGVFYVQGVCASVCTLMVFILIGVLTGSFSLVRLMQSPEIFLLSAEERHISGKGTDRCIYTLYPF